MNIGAGGGIGFGRVPSVSDPGATAGLVDATVANGGPQLQTVDSNNATAEFGSGFAITTVLPANVGVEGWEHEVYQVGDTHVRIKLSADGSIRFGSGAAVPDAILARIAAGILRANGSLEAINFVAPGNGAAVGGGLWSGAGAPGAFGANGDYYFRTDTPAVANQRVYVRSAGAWVGIL